MTIGSLIAVLAVTSHEFFLFLSVFEAAVLRAPALQTQWRLQEIFVRWAEGGRSVLWGEGLP